MSQLGRQDLSGIGFGIGIDRVIMACEAENSLNDPVTKVGFIYCPNR
jgi:histidyl-tRNA synthetase